MKTRYRLVDAENEELRTALPPWKDIPVRVQAIKYCPDNSPGGEDELVITLRYMHELSDEENHKQLGPFNACPVCHRYFYQGHSDGCSNAMRSWDE